MFCLPLSMKVCHLTLAHKDADCAERACEESLRLPEPLQQCCRVHAAGGAALQHLPVVLGAGLCSAALQTSSDTASQTMPTSTHARWRDERGLFMRGIADAIHMFMCACLNRLCLLLVGGGGHVLTYVARIGIKDALVPTGALPPEPQLHALHLCGQQLCLCTNGGNRGLQQGWLSPQPCHQRCNFVPIARARTMPLCSLLHWLRCHIPGHAR